MSHLSGLITLAYLAPQHYDFHIGDQVVSSLLFLVSHILADAEGLFSDEDFNFIIQHSCKREKLINRLILQEIESLNRKNMVMKLEDVVMFLCIMQTII